MSDDEPINPYAPPEVERVERKRGTKLQKAERIRRDHIKHEASVKSLGCLHLLGGSLMALVCLIAVVEIARGGAGAFGVLAVYGVLGVAYLASGVGLRLLAPWGRIIAAVLSGIGLLGFPIGTILNAYFLYLLLGEKGSVVFSERYKRVIADTPHVKYIPWASIVLLVVLALLIVGLAVAARM